jgi:UDP-N-acetylglucosamine 3-dehydrogenase
MEGEVNVAVLGAGHWGKKVLAEYVQLAKTDPNVTLSMICDMQNDNLEYCCYALNIAKERLAKDYRTVLQSKEVNAVHICTPNETHYSICKEALREGKHVLLEKPMALEAKHAWELVDIAKSTGLCLQVGHIFRFNNALKLMRDLVAQQYLGTIYYLKLQWTTLMDSPLNRDIIFDLGPHPVDILNYLLNKWPSKVSCKARAYRRARLEELAYMMMEFDDHIMAHVELSWLQPGKIRDATLVGSERSAVVDCANQSIRICENGDGEILSLPIEINNTIMDEAKNFADTILGKENHHNPGAIGARNVEVLEKLKESLEQEKTVKLDLRE